MTGKDLQDSQGSLFQLREQISALVRNKLDLTSQIQTEQQRMAVVRLQRDQLRARREALSLAISQRREVLQNYATLIAKAEQAQCKVTQIATQLANTLQVTQATCTRPSLQGHHN